MSLCPTLPRCSLQLLSYESGGRYPALPAAQSMTTPMLATTTPMLATNNYYQARPDCVEAKKNRPRTPKRPRPDTARRPQGLQEIRKEQRRESADFDQNQKTIKFKIGHKDPKRKNRKGCCHHPAQLLDANQLGQLSVANPDFSGHIVPNAEILTSHRALEILASQPIGQHSRSRFVVTPVGGHRVNITHDQVRNQCLHAKQTQLEDRQP